VEILVPAAAVAFVAVPAILALYLLKVRGPEVRVASFVLWPRHLVDHQANAPWKRLRLSRLLLVQLLLAVALAAALMRPGFAGASGVARTTVVLLDGSPSMQATDVKPSRFGVAVTRARHLAGQLGSTRQMAVVLLGEHAQLLAPATGDQVALRSALDQARPAGAAGNLEEGISLANALLSGRPGGSVVLLSDGHAKPPTAPPRLAAPFVYESIGTSGANAALEAIGRTPAGDVFLRVANLATEGRDLSVELRADGRLVDILPVRVEAGSTAEPVWSRLPAGTRVLEARLSPGDDFALDDSAWLVTEPAARRRVLVVGAKGFLTRALGLRSDLDLTVVSPADYEPGSYDLYVFDGFVPPGPLPEPALVVNPPEGTGPVTAGPAIDPGGLLPADPREPLLQYVSLRDVHVQQAARLVTPPGWRTIVAAANGPLLLVRQDTRVAELGFDVHRSDLPLREAFPFLVQNLASALLPSGFQDQVLPLGQPVRLVGGADVRSMEVTTPAGRRVVLSPPFPASFDDTLQPGVYTVAQRTSADTSTSRFVIQLDDPSQSRIAPGDEPVVRAASQPSGKAPRGTLEIWPWLAALALAALVAESVLFVRG
jgi:hypothetical protein